MYKIYKKYYDKGFNGTVVNRASASLRAGSLEITIKYYTQELYQLAKVIETNEDTLFWTY